MERRIFLQEEAVGETLDDHKFRSINLDKDEITFIGQPRVASDGAVSQLEMVLRIERLKVIRTIFPLASIEERPNHGHCNAGEGQCQWRKKDGHCAEDPENNNDLTPCKFLKLSEPGEE